MIGLYVEADHTNIPCSDGRMFSISHPPCADNAREFICIDTRLETLYPAIPAKPSNFGVLHAPDLHHRRGLRVWITCRVSGWENESHLDDQMMHLYRVAKANNMIVVGVSRWVWSGTDPWWLLATANRAKSAGADAHLLETIDRTIRPTTFHPQLNWDAKLRDFDLTELFHYLPAGSVLITAAHPDATPAENRAYQSNRGKQTWEREEWRELAVELHRMGGHGPREIERMTGEPKSNVSRWLKQ
jgi:hypothetical protein